MFSGNCPASRFKWSVILGLLAAGSLLGQADQLRFYPVPFGEGTRVVRDIGQDPTGFLWVATENGIFRYDSYAMKKYDKKGHGLPADRVRTLFFSESGDLWIGTVAGLAKFNRGLDRFEAVHFDDGSIALEDENVYEIVEDDKGLLWIATSIGLVFFDPATGRHGILDDSGPPSKKLTTSGILSLALDQAGFLWAATTEGLNRVDRNTLEVEHFLHDPQDPDSILSNDLNVVYCDSNGQVWIGHYRAGLDLFNPETRTFRHYKRDLDDPDALNSRSIKAIAEDVSGDLLFATWNGGVNRLKAGTRKFIHYTTDPGDPNSIGDNRVMTVFVDRQGILWVGTYTGLFKHDPLQRPFAHFRSMPGNPNSLPSNKVLSAWEDTKDRVWFGTYDAGVGIYNRKTGVFRNFQKDVDNPNALANNGVFDILEDRDHRIWLGTGSGLHRFDETNQNFVRYPVDPNGEKGIPSGDITHMMEDSKGNLWVGTWGAGLARYGPNREYDRTFSYSEEEENSLSGDIIQVLYQTRDGTVWVATGDGLDRFLPDSDSFKRVLPSSESVFQSLFQDRKGRFWIGSSSGLMQLHSDGRTSTFHDQGEPFSNAIVTIAEDSQGHLWMGTDNGLLRWETETGEWHLFQESDGVQSNSFSCCATQGADGRLYFFGPNGANAFIPEEVRLNTHPPKVVLTQFLLANKPVVSGESELLPQAIDELDALTLTHHQSHVTFEFSTVETRLPDQVTYAYRLLPFDKEWIFTDASHRRATYTGLPAASYQFQVKAANEDGVWSERNKSLTVQMLPPFWRTWWAYTFYAMTALSILILFVVSQRKKVRREQAINRQLRRVDRLKDEFLANTSHELRTPLHGIVGLTEALLEGAGGPIQAPMRKQLGMIANSGKRLTYLVNDILDFSKLRNHQLALDLKAVDLHIISEVVIRLCEPLIGKKQLTIVNAIASDTPAPAADENRLQQILVNLIGNAIKFSDRGEIRLTAQPWENGPTGAKMLAVSVADQGIGISPDQSERIFQPFEQADGATTRAYEGTGIGLAITKSLVELHGGDIWVRSEPDKGTTFTFTLPLGEGLAQSKTVASAPLSTVKPGPAEADINTEQDVVFAGNEPHVLIVDDELVNLQVLTNFLQMAHYRVTTAENGPQALEILESQRRFDLVILDIMMPKMSGYEVCQKIRKTYPASALPVILLTAKDQVADLLSGFDAGANDYLTKPFSKDELLKRIKTHHELSKIHVSLSRFVPFEFLKILEKERITDVQLGDQCQGEMTVLFADIRSYTTLAESMSPSETFAFLNSYLGRIGPEIKKHGGFVNQYYGDGIMAIFPSSALAAVEAAVGMQTRLVAYNRERISKGREPIQIGIGIHSGPLMLGIIGDQERMDTGVVADTVNTASRMESLTKQYGTGIIVSETTYAALPKDVVQLRKLDRVRVKGKNDPLDIYEVVSKEPATAKTQMKRASGKPKD